MLQQKPETQWNAPEIDSPESQADSEEFQREEQFWRDHHQEFLEKYPKLWVVVRAGEVIVTDPDLYALWAKLDQMGVDPTSVWIEHFDPDPPVLRL